VQAPVLPATSDKRQIKGWPHCPSPGVRPTFLVVQRLKSLQRLALRMTKV